ncbi:MAG: T9SS type A sorting domain-containing protein, partial [Tannerella sp.]|nr:T9SS type A sorting domain-containing protein [Tannerella sp.]
DFEFVLLPSASTAGRVPAVTTGRADDGEGGVTVTPGADGSYNVRITAIRKHIEIGITLVPDPSSGTADVPRTGVWAAGNRLYLAAVRSGQARIYTLAGALVKTVAAVAGETVTETLPAGFYIVTLDGERKKIAISY